MQIDQKINGHGEKMILNMEIFKELIIKYVFNFLMIFKYLNKMIVGLYI